MCERILLHVFYLILSYLQCDASDMHQVSLSVVLHMMRALAIATDVMYPGVVNK